MNHDISIIASTKNKPGVLSKVIRELGHYGLIYEGQKMEINNNLRVIEFHCTGRLHCEKGRLISILEEIPNVIKIVDIIVKEDSGSDIKASEGFLGDKEPLSSAVILAAEKKLSNIIGPVATYLVEQASKECSTVGELFLMLSKELDTEEERNNLISAVQYR